MSNGFADFFETLLPRELTIYVIPGSVLLSAFLYNITETEKLITITITKELSSATYILLTVIWLSTAYTIGLIIGAIKQGILYKLIHKYAEISKSFFDTYFENFFKNRLPNINPNNGENKNQNSRSENDDTPGISSMSISFYQKDMYRREIERYGVFAQCLDNLTLALIGVVILLNNFLIRVLLIIIALVLPIGAEGYRRLQKSRIRNLKAAIDREYIDGIKINE